MKKIKNKDFLEETIKEQELLNISYKQSKQNKSDRHLESFSDDLRNSIIKKVSSKHMEQIKKLEKEVEELEVEKTLTNSQEKLDFLDETIYNTNQSIESLKNARP